MSVLSIGVQGLQLANEELDLLRHPWVGGVTLFKRNIQTPKQTAALISAIRAASPSALLLSVDQEGGRVQRVIDGASKLPALGQIGAAYARDPAHGIELARAHATVMASEMRALGFDLSFAPVLDLDRGSRVIGDRAFSADPNAVRELGRAYIEALNACGMAACIKHFPGHGSVLEDTHHERAIDPRTFAEIEASDLIPFAALGPLAQAVMLAHVEYPSVDSQPAGYSRVWIGGILRQRLGFAGVVISDDIGMLGAGNALRAVDRIGAHLQAGCDHVLVCDPALSSAVLSELNGAAPPTFANVSALLSSAAEPLDLLAARTTLYSGLHLPLLS